MSGESPERRVAHISLCGEFDVADKDRLTDLLRPAQDADDVIIDVRDVLYFDSTALGCLIHVKKEMLARGGGSVQLIGPQPTVRRLLAITGLEELFDIREEGG